MEIIDLCSDSEDYFSVCSDREGYLDYDDPNDGVNQLTVSRTTAFNKNSAEQFIRLDDDDWLNDTHTSSSYRPAENRSNTESSREVDTDFNIKNSNWQHSSLSFPTLSSSNRSHPLPLTCATNIVSSLTVKPSANQRSLVNGIGFPSPAIASGNKPYVSNGQGVLTDDDDDCIYEVLPQPFPSSHSILGHNRIEEDSTVKYTGFQTSAAKSTTDGVYAYGGLNSHRIFPPPIPYINSVNNSGVNGLGIQTHLSLEKRLFGCDERAVYEEALKHISQEKTEEDLPEGVMSVSLLKHQRIALAWMVSKENGSRCLGGILADDQGLGKTISTIALIQKERAQQSKFMSDDLGSMKSVTLDLDEDDDEVIFMDKKKLKGQSMNKLQDSTLFPLLEAASDAADLKPWASQTGSAVDNKAVKVEPKKKTRVRRPSSSTSRPATRSAAGTLVVCPASVLKQWASELAAKVTEGSKLSVLVYHGSSRTKDPTELTKYDVVVTTYTVVANEVPKQNSDEDIEEKNSETYGICPAFSIGNKRKKNGEEKKKKKSNRSDADLGGPLARVQWFRVVLDEAQTIKNYRTQVARACCGLRSMRRWCLSGTPIQNTIEDLYSYFRFLKYEPYCVYTSFRSMIKQQISYDATRGYKKLQAILKIILLRRTKETLIDGEPIIKLPPKTIELSKIDFTKEERTFYMIIEEGSREKFKEYAAAGTIRENYAHILVLLLRLRQACDHPILLKGKQSELIDTASIDVAKQLPKATVINLLGRLEGGYAICSRCNDPPEDAVVATCGHVFCNQCVHKSFTSDENVCPSPSCGKKLSAESVFSPGVLRFCIADKLESDATASSSIAADGNTSVCESSYISSKIRAATDILYSIVNTHALTESETIESSASEVVPPSKAIVFSQWTGVLDLLELSLNSSHIQFRRLDGAMSLNLRETAVKEFNTDPEVRVMLMSLKAGNLGLNMVAACHVITIDPWWNPYAEDQAVDRAHRIGQTRPVTVSRLTIKETVEDRILALQEKKRKMVQSAFGEDKPGGNATRLTIDDLQYLFGI
uniref:RING-type domain-containing protein n=1 Tax=Leersia perrieri TaxID=77586 RepID=A0A0D9W9X0_9ORYZ